MQKSRDKEPLLKLEPHLRQRASQTARFRDELAAQIEGCLMRGNPSEINLQVPRHSITSPVLRRVVYNSRYAGKLLPVVFTDGSRPPKFPAGVFTDTAADGAVSIETKEELLKRSSLVLKLGSMSMRHPDLDYLVDLYLTRNTELAIEEDTMANRERMSYEATVKALSDDALDEGGEIWFYQTGFEPMIVGVYRGLVEVLRRRRAARKKDLVVVPWLFDYGLADAHKGDSEHDRRDDEEEHAPHPDYSPDSPGAQPHFYEPLLPWR